MAKIVNAAIKYPDGDIVVGKRHGIIIRLQAKLGVGYDKDCILGFIDSSGNFLTREEAREVAIKNGQVSADFKGELYSEDIWPESLMVMQ